MTVSYSDHFWKLFFRWKGSLWKTIYKDLIVFLSLYYAVKGLYHFVLTSDQQKAFLRLIPIFNKFTEHIPLTFMLGFYVGMVVKRWWDQFMNVCWPDHFLFWVSAYIRGHDNENRLIRRTIARYCILSMVMAWRSISVRILKRFPTLEHVTKLGLMTDDERKLYEATTVRVDPHKQWFVPLNWVMTCLTKCFEQERVSHVNELVQLLSKLEAYRNGFMQLFIYDWITIPLVYTQVAVVATYGYFGLCLIGRQYVFDDKEVPLDLYVPIFTILQFLFYVGWLKVGEDLMNPFGEDDEDFEFNYLLDRHLEMAFLIVDGIHGQMPEYVETGIQNGSQVGIPHTKASGRISDKAPRSHVRNVCISESDMEIVHRLNNNDMLVNDYSELSPKISPRRRDRNPRLMGMVHRVMDLRRSNGAATESVEPVKRNLL